MSSSTEFSKHNFSARSSCEIPDFYRIHLSHTDTLLDTLKEDHSPIAEFFRSIVHGEFSKTEGSAAFEKSLETMKANYQDHKKRCEREGVSSKPFDKIYLPVIEEYQRRSIIHLADTEQKLAIDGGYDVIAIKQFVHQILGLDAYSQSPEFQHHDYKIKLTNEERDRYFQIFKNTGFLETPFDLLDSVVYDPGKTIQKILQMNPQINTLLVGCGRRAVYSHNGVCNNKDHKAWEGSGLAPKKDQIIAEHNDTSLSIDIDTYIDPHLLANIFDVKMLQSIPGERIKLISDHSNGFLCLRNLFEEESINTQEAFNEYYRILKPKGRIELVSDISDSDKEILERIGFIVDQKIRTLIKPDLSNCAANYILEREIVDG